MFPPRNIPITGFKVDLIGQNVKKQKVIWSQKKLKVSERASTLYQINCKSREIHIFRGKLLSSLYIYQDIVSFII